jgi:hypothetical protein
MYRWRGRERRLFLADYYYCYNPGWYGWCVGSKSEAKF